MYNHSGTWDFLKMLTVLGFVVLAVWWLEKQIGAQYTVLVVFALVGVALFAGGALVAAAIQKNTLNSVTRFNADDAQVDRFRMQSFKALASGQSAMNKAAAQLTVLDAKRVDRLAAQQAKLLTDSERAKREARQTAEPADAWTWDDDAGGDFQSWG